MTEILSTLICMSAGVWLRFCKRKKILRIRLSPAKNWIRTPMFVCSLLFSCQNFTFINAHWNESVRHKFHEILEPDPVMIMARLFRPDELWINKSKIGIEKKFHLWDLHIVKKVFFSSYYPLLSTASRHVFFFHWLRLLKYFAMPLY